MILSSVDRHRLGKYLERIACSATWADDFLEAAEHAHRPAIRGRLRDYYFPPGGDATRMQQCESCGRLYPCYYVAVRTFGRTPEGGPRVLGRWCVDCWIDYVADHAPEAMKLWPRGIRYDWMRGGKRPDGEGEFPDSDFDGAKLSGKFAAMRAEAAWQAAVNRMQDRGPHSAPGCQLIGLPDDDGELAREITHLEQTGELMPYAALTQVERRRPVKNTPRRCQLAPPFEPVGRGRSARTGARPTPAKLTGPHCGSVPPWPPPAVPQRVPAGQWGPPAPKRMLRLPDGRVLPLDVAFVTHRNLMSDADVALMMARNRGRLFIPRE